MNDDDTLETLGDSPGEPARADAVPAIEPGQRYEVRAELARGGMGRVLVGFDRKLGREVAIKEVLRTEDKRAVARFVREGLMTARLQHPGIVPIYEIAERPSGQPFLTMRRVEGQPLAELISAAKTPLERLGLLPNVIAAVDALAYAHERRIIHRDLKPANILVGRFGETVVIDWGLAKDLGAGAEISVEEEPSKEDSGEALTLAGSVLGTPTHMAPEQALAVAADERSDVFALGAVLHHVLTGKPPFSGKNAKEVLRAVLQGSVEPLAEASPWVPLDLQSIVLRAMAREPGDRYASARELAAELRKFQAGQLVQAHAYSLRERLTRFLRKNRAAVIAVVCILAVLAVAGTVLLKQRQATAVEHAQARARADSLIVSRAQRLLAKDPTAAIEVLRTLPADSPAMGEARGVALQARNAGLPQTMLRGDFPSSQLTREGLLFSDSSEMIWRWRAGDPEPHPLEPRLTGALGDGSANDPQGRFFLVRAGRLLLVSADRSERDLGPAGLYDSFELCGEKLFSLHDGALTLQDLATGAQEAIAAEVGSFHCGPPFGAFFRRSDGSSGLWTPRGTQSFAPGTVWHSDDFQRDGELVTYRDHAIYLFKLSDPARRLLTQVPSAPKEVQRAAGRTLIWFETEGWLVDDAGRKLQTLPITRSETGEPDDVRWLSLDRVIDANATRVAAIAPDGIGLRFPVSNAYAAAPLGEAFLLFRAGGVSLWPLPQAPPGPVPVQEHAALLDHADGSFSVWMRSVPRRVISFSPDVKRLGEAAKLPDRNVGTGVNSGAVLAVFDDSLRTFHHRAGAPAFVPGPLLPPGARLISMVGEQALLARDETTDFFGKIGDAQLEPLAIPAGRTATQSHFDCGRWGAVIELKRADGGDLALVDPAGAVHVLASMPRAIEVGACGDKSARFATLQGGEVAIVSLRGEPEQRLLLPRPATDLELSPDGAALAIAFADGTAALVQLAARAWTPIARTVPTELQWMRFSPAGSRLLMLDAEGALTSADAQTGAATLVAYDATDALFLSETKGVYVANNELIQFEDDLPPAGAALHDWIAAHPKVLDLRSGAARTP